MVSSENSLQPGRRHRVARLSSGLQSGISSEQFLDELLPMLCHHGSAMGSDRGGRLWSRAFRRVKDEIPVRSGSLASRRRPDQYSGLGRKPCVQSSAIAFLPPEVLMVCCAP